MRIIPAQVHGIADYVTGGSLLSAPSLLGLDGVPASTPPDRFVEVLVWFLDERPYR